ncbi:hypothetical protein [Brevibacterium luteolum]|uniref:Uncharacterized protein n=1 Tax=Brevibacterium luteolum TaxID=199591 RepID=A0A2N6PIK9_9MICO|nr:hypothetical protein [Brevibacterium luteolum]PMB98504.1 hypothetical protein CJ198_03960 [Brevibacterium luteolum]
MPTYVRVKDTDTKHEFDVLETHPQIGDNLQLIKSDRYPPARSPRAPKHYVKRARSTQQESPENVPSADASGESPSRPAGRNTKKEEGEESHD